MNAPAQWNTEASDGGTVFDSTALGTFGAHYPEHPHQLRHALDRHPLLEIEALAALAEQLTPASVEYNRGDLPIGVDGKPGTTGLSIGETIRCIAASNSWAVLKNVEGVPAYNALLKGLLSELSGEISATTGEILMPQAYIFISSPNAITPYHFDPEHNILLQVRGSKTMTQFPAGDTRFAPDQSHEAYHTGGPRELRWENRFQRHGKAFHLGAGDAVYVPVMAPHYVRNGQESSVSLSVTWRSEWSYAEKDARAFNYILRQFGHTPKAPSRWPAHNRGKAFAFRVLRKLRLTGLT